MVFIFNNTLLYCIIVNEFSSQFFSLSVAYQKKSHDAQKRLSVLDSVYIFARFRSLYCNGLFWALWTLRPLPTSFYSLFSISFLQTNGMSGRKTAGIRGHCRQENLWQNETTQTRRYVFQLCQPLCLQTPI